MSAALYETRCRVDEEIPAAERSAVDAVALALVQDLLAGNTARASVRMTLQAQRATPPDAMAGIAQFIKLSAPYEGVHVLHTYELDINRVGGAHIPPVHCGRTLKDPDAVMLAVGPNNRQMDVEVTAHTINNDWSTFVVLVTDQGTWKAVSFHFDTARVSGRSGRDLADLARAQAARAHGLNAALLFNAASGVADRGPNVTPVWKRELDVARASFVPPSDMAGQPPFEWRAGSRTFPVSNAGVIGIGGKLSVIVERRPKTWVDDTTADRESRDFIASIVKAHPELAEVFTAFIARTFKPDGTGGFGTVYEFGKGFDEPPAR